MPNCKFSAWLLARELSSSSAHSFSRCQTANQADPDMSNPTAAATMVGQK
jgi:hypothetical protein